MSARQGPVMGVFGDVPPSLAACSSSLVRPRMSTPMKGERGPLLLPLWRITFRKSGTHQREGSLRVLTHARQCPSSLREVVELWILIEQGGHRFHGRLDLLLTHIGPHAEAEGIRPRRAAHHEGVWQSHGDVAVPQFTNQGVKLPMFRQGEPDGQGVRMLADDMRRQVLLHNGVTATE